MWKPLKYGLLLVLLLVMYGLMDIINFFNRDEVFSISRKQVKLKKKV